MFVVTLNRASLRRLGIGLVCCAVLVCGVAAGRLIGSRSVTAAAPAAGRIENAQDLQNWFTGQGLEPDPTTVRVDKVKIPRKWDESFTAFHTVVQQSGMDLSRVKGRTVEKWTAELPAQSDGQETCCGVLLVYRKKPVGAYLLHRPSGTVTGLGDARAAMAAALGDSETVSGDEFEGDWGEEHEYILEEEASAEILIEVGPAEELPVSAEPQGVLPAEAALYTDLPVDGQGYPVE